jgi:hypothetical protein
MSVSDAVYKRVTKHWDKTAIGGIVAQPAAGLPLLILGTKTIGFPLVLLLAKR